MKSLLLSVWSDFFNQLPIQQYGEIIIGIIIGLVIVVIYHRFVGLRNLRNSYEQIIQAKDLHIHTLGHAINQDLKKIQPKPENAEILKRIRRYFREMIKNKGGS